MPRPEALTAGIDFGGTNIKLGLVDDQGRLVRGDLVPTACCSSPAAFVETMAGRITAMLAARGGRVTLHGAGIGAPGLIDQRRGVVRRVVNVPGRWTNVPLGPQLSRRLGCPCWVDNDVNVVALGEWRLGAGRGTRQSVYVTLGTGVGGGLVVDGRLVRGAWGAAGEVGHMVVQLDGPACACGGRGCLESLIGTAAILRRARQSIRGGRSPRLARLVRGGRELTPALISAAAQAGDRGARGIWESVGEALGAGLAGLVNLLNPERMVIGGGIAKAWPWFAPSMQAAVHARSFVAAQRRVRIVRASLGSAAGVLGAAVLVWEQTGRMR